MPTAGIYSEPCEWRAVVKTRSAATGQQVTTWPALTGTLWCGIEESSASEQDDGGGRTHTVRATIRVRQYPDLSQDDRLTDTYGQVWHLSGIVYGDNELVCDAYRLDREA